MGYGPGVAHFYHHHWGVFSRQAAPAVFQWYQARYPRSGRRLLDLCCGTGESFAPFARAGWNVTGVDVSVSMLDVARANWPADRVRLIEADVADVDLGEQEFDLVLCLFDSINHLPDQEAVTAMLHKARAHAAQGAVLVLDANTDQSLRALGEPWLIDDQVGTLFVSTQFDPDRRVARMELLGYLRMPDGTYERFEETVTERALSADQIDQSLQESGWGTWRSTSYDDLDAQIDPGSHGDGSSRLVVVANA